MNSEAPDSIRSSAETPALRRTSRNTEDRTDVKQEKSGLAQNKVSEGSQATSKTVKQPHDTASGTRNHSERRAQRTVWGHTANQETTTTSWTRPGTRLGQVERRRTEGPLRSRIRKKERTGLAQGHKGGRKNRTVQEDEVRRKMPGLEDATNGNKTGRNSREEEAKKQKQKERRLTVLD